MRATSSELRGPECADLQNAPSRTGRPLVIDLDEVLLHTSLFPENVLPEIALRFRAIAGQVVAGHGPHTPAWLAKPFRSKRFQFDPTRVLYDADVVAFLLRVIGEGRPIYLCSETYPEPLVDAVAGHLGILTAWSAADRGKPATERTASLPAALRRGFDYLGEHVLALPVASTPVERSTVLTKAAPAPIGARVWLKLLRVHQYAKNALVLVPLLTAHKVGLLPATTAMLAAIAFSLGASGAYILNDLLDIKADRAHPTKCNRPIASGAISPARAVCAMGLMLVAALVIAISISAAFGAVLVGYLALTTAYSCWLKRVPIVDVVALAVLYTIRVIGGAVAISVTMSEWLLAFSLFMFMSLALVKRHVELAGQPDGKAIAGRGYRTDDKSMVAILAAAAGFNAVVIFTLYISSDTVRALYSYPQLLWLNCPILMCWIGRVMLLAQRGMIDDDPVIFALRDRASWLALTAIGAIMLAAT